MSFSLDLSRARRNIMAETEKVVRGTLIQLSNSIILKTPVGDPSLWKNPAPPGYVGGTLRAAWNASIGTPNEVAHNRVDESGQSATAEATQIAVSLDIGETFYLTNPQPYANRVEFGWSSQAPAGMLRISVAEFQIALDKL